MRPRWHTVSGFTVALVLSGHMPLEVAQVLLAPVSGAGRRSPVRR